MFLYCMWCKFDWEEQYIFWQLCDAIIYVRMMLR